MFPTPPHPPRTTPPCSSRRAAVVMLATLSWTAAAGPAGGQVSGSQRSLDPVGVAEGASTDEWVFHTFSIVAVDAETGETGVAVTTRNACVGNGVPWVRAGVGAVATQASTRPEYGDELLDLLEVGVPPAEALDRLLGDDAGARQRQIGVVAVDGRTAQHTGDGANAWAGHRSGAGYAVQGNLLVGPQVLDAVSASFEATAGSGRHLADRLVAALEAGHARGGDARHGRIQSAAVLVADPRDGMARRPDGQTVFIHVCEHPDPVEELRRIHDTVAGTLGHRELRSFDGGDVAQLQVLLNLLGHYRPEETEPSRDALGAFDGETVQAVERFREAAGLATAAMGSPSGLVDREFVDALWAALDAAGLQEEARRRIRPYTQIRR